MRTLKLKNAGWLLLALPMLSAALSGQVYEGLVLPFQEVTVSSQVQSFIVEHEVREGDLVERGQLLTRLFSRVEELEMSRARALVEKREFDYRGAESLFADRLISEDEALAARIELDLARLQYEIAEENVRLREIRAPISGLVVERLLETGETVRATDPLFVLVDIDQVYILFYVGVEDLIRLQTGQVVSVSFPEIDEEVPMVGTIDFIDPRVDAASGLARIRVLMENPERKIKAGIRAQVRLEPPTG